MHTSALQANTKKMPGYQELSALVVGSIAFFSLPHQTFASPSGG
jgi:hypothetical protein